MSQPAAATAQSRDPDSDLESVASLPESESSSDIESEDEGGSDADREWHESLKQLELLLTMVLVPYLGKYFGRKAAYWCEYTMLCSCYRQFPSSETDYNDSLCKIHYVEVPC